MISYQKLWTLLEERGISQNALRKEYGISSQCILALKQNKYVRTALLDRLCAELSCDVTELFEQTEDNDEL